MLRATLVLLTLFALPAAAGAQCEVTGVASIERMRVRIPGERLRTLVTHDMPVAVRPGAGVGFRDVRVLAPIHISGRSDARMPWTAPRPMAFASGVLWMVPGVEIERVAEAHRDGHLEFRAQVDNGVWVSRVEAPCSDLALGSGETGDLGSAPAWVHATGTPWMPHDNSFWLRAAHPVTGVLAGPPGNVLTGPQTTRRDPDPSARVRIDAPNGLPRPLIEVERRGEYARVVLPFESGAAVRGWIRAVELRAVTEPLHARPYRRARPNVPEHTCRTPQPERGQYLGPAHIAAGAIVHTAPEGTAWASADDSDIPVTVAWRSGERWVRIVSVPGLRDSGDCPAILRRAWVERHSVRLQGESD